MRPELKTTAQKLNTEINDHQITRHDNYYYYTLLTMQIKEKTNPIAPVIVNVNDGEWVYQVRTPLNLTLHKLAKP